MDPNTFPTKGNLILAKNSLKLAHMGYELMDKKRNILIRELMGLIDEAKDIQRQIDVTFREAYAALQIANMEIGITNVQTVSYTVPVEESIRIKTRSIMGVEIPLVEADQSGQAPTYAYYSTKESLDQARQAFEKVKDLTLNLSMIENSAYRLAAAIKKTQKRANALKNITIPRQQECTECHGSGCAAGSSPETCPDCGGRGYVIRQQRTPFGVMQTQQPCSRCGGKGKLVKNPCKVCHGSGKTAARKTLEVSIPMGIDDDQSFALRGMGDAGANGGPAGDVIVMVTVRPSEVFQRDGYDVWVTVPITYSQAVLGDSITVPSIDGKVEYTVPEGTQSGTTFRLRGKGIQYLNGRGRGDMYVKCEVEIPKKLNKAQRDALKKFEGTLKEENYEKRKGFFKKLKDMFA